ncbi:hypothetical protein H4582DRAFT_2013543 [Lactarius indigo]|nr:hypothetical protein H4582DRAFT_2013543 [Lactarius indigo]
MISRGMGTMLLFGLLFLRRPQRQLHDTEGTRRYRSRWGVVAEEASAYIRSIALYPFPYDVILWSSRLRPRTRMSSISENIE